MVRYRVLQYVVLPDGTLAYGVIQLSTSPPLLDEVIGWGMGLILMAVVMGMVRSLMTDSLLPDKATLRHLPATVDQTGHRELFEKLEAMTPEQRAAWAQDHGWGSTSDSAYRSLFSSTLRIPLRKGETWRSRANAYIRKYYPELLPKTTAKPMSRIPLNLKVNMVTGSWVPENNVKRPSC